MYKIIQDPRVESGEEWSDMEKFRARKNESLHSQSWRHNMESEWLEQSQYMCSAKSCVEKSFGFAGHSVGDYVIVAVAWEQPWVIQKWMWVDLSGIKGKKESQ